MKTDVDNRRLDSERKSFLVGDQVAQRRLHAEARKAFGTLQDGDELLAQEARTRVRRKLSKRLPTTDPDDTCPTRPRRSGSPPG